MSESPTDKDLILAGQIEKMIIGMDADPRRRGKIAAMYGYSQEVERAVTKVLPPHMRERVRWFRDTEPRRPGSLFVETFQIPTPVEELQRESAQGKLLLLTKVPVGTRFLSATVKSGHLRIHGLVRAPSGPVEVDSRWRERAIIVRALGDSFCPEPSPIEDHPEACLTFIGTARTSDGTELHVFEVHPEGSSDAAS